MSPAPFSIIVNGRLWPVQTNETQRAKIDTSDSPPLTMRFVTAEQVTIIDTQFSLDKLVAPIEVGACRETTDWR